MKEKISQSEVFGKELVNIGKDECRLIVLDADLSKSTKTCYFQQTFPDRFFNIGVAEANMVDIAAGFAATNMIPVCCTFSFLLTLRAADQIRSSISYTKLNVKMIGAYGGVSDSYDGPSHHSICDLALLQAMPNIIVLCPADPEETKQALRTIIAYKGPVFMRLSRNPIPYLLPKYCKFKIGKGIIIKPGKDITLISTGIILNRTLKAEEKLKEQGIDAAVIHIGTVKPLDSELLVHAAQETGAIVTVEEHNIKGGLGSAIAGVISEKRPVPIIRVGIKDTFTRTGPYEKILDEFGLSVDNIISAAKVGFKLKNG